MIPAHRQKPYAAVSTPGSGMPASAGSRLTIALTFCILLTVTAVSGGMKLLAPRADEFVRTDEFIVAVGIPPESKRVRLFFDDQEISPLQRAAATITFIPDDAFLSQPGIEGPHRITVKRYGELSDLMEQFTTLVYLFSSDTLSQAARDAMIKQGEILTAVSPVKTPAPYHNGRVSSWFEAEAFLDSGRTVAEADAWGNGGAGAISYDYNITLRTDEQSHYQSLQRFRAAVAYRTIARLSLGDNWPTYHKSILRQQRVRGLELNLNTPGNLVGLDLVWGQSQRAVKPYAINEAALADADEHNDSTALLSPGTYSRYLTALRLSLDIPQLFTANITVCKAIDDTGSIQQLTLVDPTGLDTAVTGKTPMDNLVYGADARLSLFRGKTELYGSFAMSWLTTDISEGALSREDLKDYFDTDVQLIKPKHLEPLLIINRTTIPLPLPVNENDAINMRSLASSMNWDAGIRLKLPLYGTKSRTEIKYYYTGPAYTSLGSPFEVIDRAGWMVSSDARFFDNRFFLKGNATWYHKDLFEISGTPTSVFHTSISGHLKPWSYLPTLVLLVSTSDENARTSDAIDPDRRHRYATVGGALQYTNSIGLLTPSITLSYYNTGTKIRSRYLSDPFTMRSHTVSANLSSRINNSRFEPCAAFSLNTTTKDLPFSLFAASAGTRIHIIPKFFTADLLAGYSGTDDPQYHDRNDILLKGGAKYEISKRNSLWIDVSIKLSVEGDTPDSRFKFNYELRY